ncbi:MAG: HD domain-containing protein [Alphaproteobacteria bacterium]|nr:HD domain-containing protein [Alphaproteobacteria bacterium]MBQ9235132.1 HD domain-containing protein [Alphaproteobacteria bacterium]
MQEDILNKTYQFAEEYHSRDNSGHDFEHIKRVYANINKLLNEEKNANIFICKMSALLHDVDDHKMNTDGKVAERFLHSLNIDINTIKTILKTIDAISFSKSGANPNFKTLEMKLLSDADKLDAMGAIGICRALSFSFSRHQPLFNENELPSPENNKKHMINHFFEKLLLLKGAMQTEVGKKEAEKRHQFMVKFLQQFFAEQNLDNWQDFLIKYINANEKV